ncbi:hypothetical protein CkaCkLH20_04350 [Colletotrichum karsti]|uniref:SCP domain-containing protein n=1 Tax=Colletotrichum karsti TaxID=1095194 RepID=A0A9P6LN98_9PEZI|nr:uncharacterized protein CkaCkLH20_04350 [Colletotrichum karsti]KAF9878312.1 hypothetical protein CkaCkLH20_04350 [Colletotrichum karsti]
MRFSISATVSAALLAANAAAQLIPVTLTEPTSSVGTPVFYTTTFITSTRTATIRLSNSTSSINYNSSTSIRALSGSLSPVLPTVSVLPTTLVASTTRVLSTAIPTPTAVPGVTADQQQALDLHNAARKAVGAPPLTWDASLANDALTYAKTLGSVDVMSHDPLNGARGQGENLYYQFGSGNPPYTAATTWWLNEKKLYGGQAIPKNSPDGSTFSQYGHYTQAIWKSTSRVGMAIANSASGKTYVVARYASAGNV